MWVNMGMIHGEGEVKVASGAVMREMRPGDILNCAG